MSPGISRNFSSSCFQGGTILVYTGLIRKAKDDDSLACLVAHEMAHVSTGVVLVLETVFLAESFILFF